MSNFMQAKFIQSAEKLSQCPKFNLSEFPLLGRSNVGKSSFINCLSNNKKLAKTKPQLEILRLQQHNNNFYENQLVCKIVHKF